MVRGSKFVVALALVFLTLGWRGAALYAQVPSTQSEGTLTQERQQRFHWYALSAAQFSKLVEALKGVPEGQRKSVWVLCDQTQDCRDLAQGILLALEQAGWEAELERPGEIAKGMVITCFELADAVTQSTHIPLSLMAPDDPEHCAINIGRKQK